MLLRNDSGHGRARDEGPREVLVTTSRTAGSGARRAILVVVGLAAVVGIGWFVRGRTRALPGKDAAVVPEARPVPVSIVTVERRDVPVLIEGLGSVVALATVNVRSQVEGRLEKVLFKEGQAVKRGDVLAQVDARPYAIQLHQAQASVARDTALKENARRTLERSIALRAENLVTDQQVDDQRASVAQLDAALRADQAQMESARLNMDYARIVSPIDGVTGVRQVDPGNIVRATDATPIVVVTQLDPIAVVFSLPEDDLPRVSKQLAAGPVVIEAYARDGRTRLATGELALIDNQINQATATIKLKATFANADRQLWPNQFVKARVLLTTRKGALAVPATAVQRGPQGTFVYAVGPDQRAVAKPVRVDAIEGETAMLGSGVEAGERIVAEGQAQLRPGARVATKPAGSGAPSASGGPPGSGAPAASERPRGHGEAGAPGAR